MLARALVVLLLMLNFGVATWWMLRPDPLPPSSYRVPDGVERLRLPGEGQVGGAPAAARAPPAEAPSAAVPTQDVEAGEDDPEAVAATAQTPGADADADTAAAAIAEQAAAAPASAMRCFSFGPYANAAAVAAARARLQPLGAQRISVRDELSAPRGWRVVLPPQADRAAATALAARIGAAGFSDFLVVSSGEDANGIALGRYSGESAARRREAALRDAGFPAQAQPVGDATTRHWLDVAAGSGFDAAAARTASGAAQGNPLDCAAVLEAAGAR